MVVPAFAARVLVYDRVISLEVSGIGLGLIAYPLAGFLAVFLPGKVAPSRQMLIALECAFLVAAFTAGIMVYVTNTWRAAESSGGVTAFAQAYLLIIVAGSLSALWMVRRRRKGPIAGDLPWAICVSVLIPVAFLGMILARGFLMD